MFAIEGKAMLVATFAVLMLSPSATQPSMLKENTLVEVEEPTWTVVHPKHKGRSPMALAHVSQEPEKEEKQAKELVIEKAVKEAVEPVEKVVKTLRDRIWQMGRDMCKNRAASDHCKRFGITGKDKEEEQDAESEGPQKEEPKTAPTEEPTESGRDGEEEPAPAPAPAPAEDSTEPAPSPAQKEPESLMVPVPAPAEEKEQEEETSAPAPAPASPAASERKERKGQEKDESEEEDKPSNPPKLQSQGFRGKGVRHIDGKTATGDWRDEYGHGRHKHRRERQERSHTRSATVLKSLTTLWTSLLVMCSILYNF